MKGKDVLSDGLQISRIEIDGLFGELDYNLEIPKIGGKHPGQLMLLYGDNGTGKTTILSLLHHMLSKADAKGHRSFVARTEFKRFKISFANNFSLAAERPQGGPGPYTLILRKDDIVVDSVTVSARMDDDEIRVTSGDVDEGRLQAIFDRLERGRATSFFLSDDRNLNSDIFDDDDLAEDDFSLHLTIHDYQRIKKRRYRDKANSDVRLNSSISRVMQWMRRQALRASNENQQTASQIYVEIVKRISSGAADQANRDSARSAIQSRISSIAERTEDLVDLGLFAGIPSNEFYNLISKLAPDEVSLVAYILDPYLESLESRISDIESVGNRVVKFRDSINSFFNRKSLSIDVDNGIEIRTLDLNKLTPTHLSSGERQLLLLLANVLLGTSTGGVFIIDEPEISLNVKWQRKLMGALLEIAYDSDIQFIIATHSIEILSNHDDCVVELNA